MTTTSSNWLSVIALRLNQSDKNLPIAFNWRQSLKTIQLRVVGFAYHRDQFLDLQTRSGEPNSDMFNLTFPDNQTVEILTLDAALAGAQLWAASQALHSACNMMLHIFDSTRGWQRPADDGSNTNIQREHRSCLAMKRLRNSVAFQYLDGFVTRSNHQLLLRVSARRVRSEDKTHQQLMIDAFVHEFDATVLSFASKWVDDFLCRDCEGLIALCSQLGEAVASEIS